MKQWKVNRDQISIHTIVAARNTRSGLYRDVSRFDVYDSTGCKQTCKILFGIMNRKILRISLLFGLVAICSVAASTIETVSDDDLVKLIKTEQSVVVLFTKKNCALCEKYETQLVGFKDDLAESFSARTIKVENSQLLRLYSTDKEPVLVSFKYGIPLLHDGPLNGEDIFASFMDNKQPNVKELTDESFEHLTQASSGATTGDWFIMFYTPHCVECVRMVARWETVGYKLKQRINVARVDAHTTGAATARRFNVLTAPEFIFFRNGKMYRYQMQRYDVQSLVTFAKTGYKNARAEPVPVPQTPFDDLVQAIANFLRENPWIMKLLSIIIGVVIIISAASKYRYRTEVEQKKD